MKPASPRHIENDVGPERERLSDEEARSIRAHCAEQIGPGTRRLVASRPPRVDPGAVRFARNGPTLYLGLLGQAFGFLHLYDRSASADGTDRAERLKLAQDYLEAASLAISRSGFPPPADWLSFHATGGLSAVAAVLQHRLGDLVAAERHLDDYRRLAAAAAEPGYPSEDLLWGRGGFLFGAAFLRSQLGEKSVTDEAIVPVLEAMIAAGRRLASQHASELTPGRQGRTPLLYMNLNAWVMERFVRAVLGRRWGRVRWLSRAATRIGGAWEERSFGLSHRYDLSLVHGLPGNLHLLMHFPELLAAHPDWERDVRQSLDCLSDCVDAERGMLELLPSPRSDAIQARRGTGRFTERVHWCGGTPGMVFVFSRAFEVFADSRYRETAERAADHVWKYGLVRKGNGICHGVAGNGYAFLALHRATSDPLALDRALHFARHSLSPRVVQQQRTPDRPDSLYEGAMGTLCFYADCLDPKRARFPGFEV